MSYTIGDLINDVLPRIGKIDNKGGITIWSAANSILSLLTKKLLDRKSDLLATGNLFLIIPAYDYCASIPSDLLSIAEKPRATQAPSWLKDTGWMAGTVTSYDSITRTLVINVTSFNGSGIISSWHIAVGVLPGQPIYTIDTSASAVLVGTGPKTFVTVTALSLVPGQNIIVTDEVLPTDSEIHTHMQPEYLDEDNHEDYYWWKEYKYYGETFDTAAIIPRRYKVLGNKFYVNPKVTGPVMITGLYNAKPSNFITQTDVIPWDGKFDEIFKEGTVRIVLKGIAIPEVDQDFMVFLNREFDIVINSRARIIPSTRRTKSANFM